MASHGQTGPADRNAKSPASSAERTPAEIEADIDQARLRLAHTVDEIVDRVKPKNVLRRTLAAVRSKFVDDSGRLRPDRIAAVAVAATAVVALVAWRKSR
jgi:hypothetical protein